MPKGSKRRAGPGGGGTGGANAEWEGRRRGPRGVPHSPAEGQVPRHVPVPCLRRAYAGGRAARAPPPPHPQLPHPPRKGARAAGGRRGDMGEDNSGKRTPPPEDAAAGWGGRGTRGRDIPHDRAQREHAPCRPQRGDHRGCNRGKGRVTAGATQQAPPPPSGATSAAPRACDVLTTCLRNRADSEEAPPPPPTPPPTHEKGEDSEETARGHGGGQRKKKKTNNKGHQHARAGAGSRGRRDMVGDREHGKGRGTGGRPWGRKQEAVTNTATNGGSRGDKSPRKTLVRYPTSGVWGPPRCPYRPHLSAGNKVGYALNRWPAARGGTGLGGWPMGLTKSTPHGTYCGSCPVRGCG